MTFFDTPWLKAKETESDFVIINDILVSGYNAKGKVTIPEGVTKLADASLSFTAITEVYLPKSLVEIGVGAFGGCSSLKEVYMKDNVKKIGEFAFEECKSLEFIQLSKKLTEIDNIFWRGCKSLKSLEIPAAVKKIDENIFTACAKSFTILVHENSAIHKYAKKNDVAYKVIGTDKKIQIPYTVVKVKKGDSLWKISKKYLGDGNRFQEIVKLNNLKNNTLYVGQKLKVPTK